MACTADDREGRMVGVRSRMSDSSLVQHFIVTSQGNTGTERMKFIINYTCIVIITPFPFIKNACVPPILYRINYNNTQIINHGVLIPFLFLIVSKK